MSEDISLQKKLASEYKTLTVMVRIYCQSHHQQVRQNKSSFCSDCAELLDYALVRLDRCPYGEKKPTCNKCPVHCYKPEQKQQAKTIMAYAGPRMLLKHPIIAIGHLLRETKAVPEFIPPAQSNRHLRINAKK